MQKPSDERAQRLSDALRANLRKRKQSQRQPEPTDEPNAPANSGQ